MTEAKVRKIILWVSKIAILVISAPATMGVVDLAYAGKQISPFVLFIIKVAVLVMVEGAFLYFWQLVEDNKSLQTKEEQEQNTYIISAWLMYLVLLIIGVLHGEGVASFIFRFAMGLLMFVSTNDKLAAMRRKYQSERASGKRESRKVRKAKANAEEEVVLHLVEKNKDQQIAAIDAQIDLLARVSAIATQQKILALNGVDIIDGEVIEVRELPSGEQKTNPEENIEETATPISEPETKAVEIVENDCYVLVPVDGGYKVNCKQCSYEVVKKFDGTKDARLSAIRAASRHCGTHKTGETVEETETKSEEKFSSRLQPPSVAAGEF